jgi:hypothetical protein
MKTLDDIVTLVTKAATGDPADTRWEKEYDSIKREITSLIKAGSIFFIT